MILKLEIDSETALDLCIFHASCMKYVVNVNIGNDPLVYSRVAKMMNVFEAEVIKRLPMEEFERIKSMED